MKLWRGEQGVDDLRDDGVFVAVDAGEKRFALFDGTKQIAADFILDGAGLRRGDQNRECALGRPGCAVWNVLKIASMCLTSFRSRSAVPAWAGDRTTPN